MSNFKECHYVLETVAIFLKPRRRKVQRRYLVPVNQSGSPIGSPFYLNKNEKAANLAKKLGMKIVSTREA